MAIKDDRLDALLKEALQPDDTEKADMRQMLAAAKTHAARAPVKEKHALEIWLSVGAIALALLELLAIGWLRYALPGQAAAHIITVALATLSAVTLLGTAIAAILAIRRSPSSSHPILAQ